MHDGERATKQAFDGTGINAFSECGTSFIGGEAETLAVHWKAHDYACNDSSLQ